MSMNAPRASRIGDRIAVSTEQTESRLRVSDVKPSEAWEARILPENKLFVTYKAPNSNKFEPAPGAILVNPTSIKESVIPQYSMRGVLGLSHEVVQYARTASRKITFQVWVCAIVVSADKGEIEDASKVRNFWHGLCMPWAEGLPPPLVNITAPYFKLNFTGFVTDMGVNYENFCVNGMPMAYTIDLSMVEVLPETGTLTGATEVSSSSK
jgi:hypothetical protein